jgi:hypothetical protein
LACLEVEAAGEAARFTDSAGTRSGVEFSGARVEPRKARVHGTGDIKNQEGVGLRIATVFCSLNVLHGRVNEGLLGASVQQGDDEQLQEPSRHPSGMSISRTDVNSRVPVPGVRGLA